MIGLNEALAIQKKKLEDEGYTVAYICIYGSQNYGLDLHTIEYQSDIDMKAIIVPNLDDLIQDNKWTSKVVETEWGQCEIKDIRKHFQTMMKANPAYLETIFTDYYIVDEKFQDEFSQVFELRDELVKSLSAQLVRAMYGTMCEKEKAMKHPYPTIAHKIEKYGYDGKQVHHILRLWIMMVDYFIEGNSMVNCMKPYKKKTDMRKLKLNEYSLEEAEALAQYYMKSAKLLKEKTLSEIDESKIDYSVKNTYLKLSQSIIKNKIINDYNTNGKGGN